MRVPCPVCPIFWPAHPLLPLSNSRLLTNFVGAGKQGVEALGLFVLSLRQHSTSTCFRFAQGGAIIFIDELDAIGTKRFGGEQSGDREVQRTMLELLNQLDGFSSNEKIKVERRRYK